MRQLKRSLRTKPNLRSQTRASAQHPAIAMRSSRIVAARPHVKPTVSPAVGQFDFP